MADKVRITDLDVKKVDVQMPYELKTSIGQLKSVQIFEDTIQITLFNQGTGTVTIWVYKTSTQNWTKLVLL